ncbi:MAG: hypothetical protein ACPG6B_06790 [Oceanihabitans sp.]
MSRFLFFIVFSIFLVGCNCSNQVISQTIVSEKVEGFLPQATFEVLNTIEQISYFKVTPTLIEGTEDEFSNKSLFVRDLSESEIQELLQYLKNDDSYQWTKYSEEINFEAANQFVCKSEEGQFNLLTNKKKSLVSIISLDGQRIIPINQNFTSYLNNLSN